jgi:hypothetical protein
MKELGEGAKWRHGLDPAWLSVTKAPALCKAPAFCNPPAYSNPLDKKYLLWRVLDCVLPLPPFAPTPYPLSLFSSQIQTK